MRKSQLLSKALLSVVLALATTPLLTVDALAQAITIDTSSAGVPQVFGVGGTAVGTWTISPPLLSLATNLSTSGTVQAAGVTSSGNITATNTVTAGSVSVSGNVSVNGSVGTNGQITSGSYILADVYMMAPAFYHSSDARLKTEIHPIDNALDKLLKIHGVEFNWKKDGRADMGVVAQNVAEVFPNVVTTGENGMMAVEYDSFVGPMIEALRTLKQQNDELSEKVAALDELKAQIQQINATVQDLKKENAELRSIKADGAENAGVQHSVTISQ